MANLIAGATVLIIDDTPGNLAVAVDQLESSGLRVLVAQDGEEGLARARFAAPDLILLDVMLPGIDGFETCRRLKADGRTCDIPVIFMTALAASSDKLLGFEAGGVDYISKPFNVAEAMARIAVHLALRRTQLELMRQNAALLREVGERSRAQDAALLARRALAESEDRYRRLVENSQDAVFLVQGGVIVFANRAAAALYGAEEADALRGRSMFDLVGPASRADAVAAIEALDQGMPVYAQEESGLRLDGRVVDMAVTRIAFAFEDGPAIQMVARALSGPAGTPAGSLRHAPRDAITGLPEGELLLDRLSQALRHARRRDAGLVVCNLGLDGFEALNERLGREAGDALLAEVARRLSACLRETDTVARQGADEFVLVLEDAGEAMQAVQRAMASFASPFRLAGAELRVLCSAGCARYPEDASRPEDLLELARAARREARRSGGNALRLHRRVSSAGPTALVIDDDALARAGAARVLKGEGYRVLTAGRQQEAIELLRRQEVGVVVSALRPGDHEAPEFLDMVGRIRPHAVRVVFASRRDAPAAAAAVALGAAHRFLLKPFEDAELRAALMEAFAKEARGREDEGD